MSTEPSTDLVPFTNNQGIYIFNGAIPQESSAESRFERAVEEMLLNEMQSRIDFITKHMQERERNLNEDCGYPSVITPWDYWHTYLDNEIAARVVEIFPYEAWQSMPTVTEGEGHDPENPSDFEQDWAEVSRKLYGESSYFLDKDASTLWDYMRRGHVMSRVGRYGVLLIGVDDGKPLDQPVDGVDEFGSLSATQEPATKETPNPAVSWNNLESGGKETEYSYVANAHGGMALNKKPPAYKLTFNAVQPNSKAPRRKVTYMRVFPEVLAQVVAWEANPTSPRLGKPTQYLVTYNQPTDTGSSGSTPTNLSHTVHWTRIVHLVENPEPNEVFHTPPMRQVFKRLMDCAKLLGSSAEMYYSGAFPGLAFETNPQAGGNVQIDEKAIGRKVTEYMLHMRRHLVGKNFSIKSLSPQVVDPSPQLAAQLEAITIRIGCPMRIFKGSERGELSSEQDDDKWDEVKKGIQNYTLTPRYVAPVVDRFIKLGIVRQPSSGSFGAAWPDITAQTDSEKADLASKLSSALSSYTSSGADGYLPFTAYMLYVLKWDQKIVDAVNELMEQARKGDEVGGSPLLALAGGVTAIAQLYTLVAQGNMTVEQLRQNIMLFYRVDEATADALVADAEDMLAQKEERRAQMAAALTGGDGSSGGGGGDNGPPGSNNAPGDGGSRNGAQEKTTARG